MAGRRGDNEQRALPERDMLVIDMEKWWKFFSQR